MDSRVLYAAEISRILNCNLLFLDESGFNEHKRRAYGYSPINTKAYLTVPGNKNINRSLMCMIIVSGFIAYKYITGAFNSNSFIEFIVPYFNDNPEKILIMDNAIFHKTVNVREIFRLHNISNKFITPYSPELNPIEEFFSMIKSKFNFKRVEMPHLTIKQALNSVFNIRNTFSVECAGFFKNMREWLEKARRKEHFYDKYFLNK